MPIVKPEGSVLDCRILNVQLIIPVLLMSDDVHGAASLLLSKHVNVHPDIFVAVLASLVISIKLPEILDPQSVPEPIMLHVVLLPIKPPDTEYVLDWLLLNLSLNSRC